MRVGDYTGQERRPQAQPCNCYPAGQPDPHLGLVPQPGSESTPRDSSLSTCIQNPGERKERGVSKVLHVSMCLQLGQVFSLWEPQLVGSIILHLRVSVGIRNITPVSSTILHLRVSVGIRNITTVGSIILHLRVILGVRNYHLLKTVSTLPAT